MDLQRSAKSMAEIAALPALGTTQCMAHVRALGGTYEAETIVHLLQRSVALHDTSLFELCGRCLIGSEKPDGRWHGGHCEGIIVNLARSFGFLADTGLMREFRSNCHGEMWKAIYDGRTFWGLRFGLAFRGKCIEVARALVREASEGVHERAFSSRATRAVPDVDDIADADGTLMDDQVVARLSNPAHQALLLAAVRGLPRRQGAAVFLAWVLGHSVEGPGGVANLMAITPRGVRLLLAKGRKTLRSDPSIRAIWFGEA